MSALMNNFHPSAINHSLPVIERRQTLLAVCVAAIASYLYAYALLKFGVYVSFMSGNTTMAGLRTGAEHWTAVFAPILTIASFIGGSFAGTWDDNVSQT